MSNSHAGFARLKLGLLAAAVTAFLVVAPSASAVVPNNGWGYGIADDTATHLQAPFQALGPKIYRLQVPWDASWVRPSKQNGVKICTDRENNGAGDGNCDNLTAHYKGMIDHAKVLGAQEIAVTIRGSDWELWEHGNYGVSCAQMNESQGGNGNCYPGPERYKNGLTQTITALAGVVDVWSPANEPNAGASWMPGENGAAILAAYWTTLTKLRDSIDSSAKLMSPDFHDQKDLQSIKWYLSAYKASGGGFGYAAAFHPYNAVHQATTASAVKKTTESFIQAVKELTGISNPLIWLTELGAYYRYQDGTVFGEDNQNTKVGWIVSQLGSLPNVGRIYYYNMGYHNDSKTSDSGLLDISGNPRKAWYTWCAAASCPGWGGAPPPPPQSNYMGIIHGNGSVWLKYGLPGGQWLLMGGLEFNARDVELDAGKMAVIDSFGGVWLKNGLPGSTWQLMFGPEFDARDVEISGNRIAVLHGNGSVWIKDGLPGGPIHWIGGGVGWGKDIELEGERLAVASHDGSVLLKTQLPWGAWHMIFGPEFETKEVEVSGEHVAIIHNNGSIWLKEGLPGGPIHLLGGLEFAGKDIELDAGRLALLHGNGSVWLKNGLPGSTWEVMFGLEFAAKDIEISGNRLALIHGNGSTWMKEGLPGGPIYLMGGLEFAANDLALW